MKITDIKINPDNPRVIRDEKFQQLKKSIQEFPKMMKLRPIVIDSSNMVLGGNQRLKALQDLQYKEIPDEWVRKASELTEDEKRRFIIADNVGFGTHDWEKITNDWDAKDLEDWGLDVPEMDDGEINDINEIYEFNETVNFTIKCDSLEQLDELKTKLNCDSLKITYNDFLIKAGL